MRIKMRIEMRMLRSCTNIQGHYPTTYIDILRRRSDVYGRVASSRSPITSINSSHISPAYEAKRGKHVPTPRFW